MGQQAHQFAPQRQQDMQGMVNSYGQQRNLITTIDLIKSLNSCGNGKSTSTNQTTSGNGQSNNFTAADSNTQEDNNVGMSRQSKGLQEINGLS